jgi:hypothetical protein
MSSDEENIDVLKTEIRHLQNQYENKSRECGMMARREKFVAKSLKKLRAARDSFVGDMKSPIYHALLNSIALLERRSYDIGQEYQRAEVDRFSIEEQLTELQTQYRDMHGDYVPILGVIRLDELLDSSTNDRSERSIARER